MNTTLTILLLVALTINIVCLWTFCRTVEESKENVKETMCNAIKKAYHDWYWSISDGTSLDEYFRNNFDKYL